MVLFYLCLSYPVVGSPMCLACLELFRLLNMFLFQHTCASEPLILPSPLFSNIWYVQFDWEGGLPLRYPQRDLIIYEMHVRGFTKHDSSKTNFPGTYLGVVEKLDHLKVTPQ